MNKDIVLLSRLDSGIRMYSEINNYLSFQLSSQKNIDVWQISCNGALNTCTVFNAHGVTDSLPLPQKKLICKQCIKAQNNKHFHNISISNASLHENQKLFIENLRREILNTNKLSSILDYKFLGIPVCRIAFFDWSIVLKLNASNILDSSKINRFILGVEDQFIIHNNLVDFFCKREIKALFYINGNYSQNTLLRMMLRNSKCLSIEPQPFSHSFFTKIILVPDRLEINPCALNNNMDKTTSPASFQNYLETLNNRIMGKEYNAYTNLTVTHTTKQKIANFNRFCKKFKAIHTYFAHSSDEFNPHEVTHGINSYHADYAEFNSQENFLEWLISEAWNYPEIGFIIRLHPRMSINKRDKFNSVELTRLMEILIKECPSNIFVIDASSNISSYYVIYKSNLIIVGWSTIGMEALALGKNVVALFESKMMYPISRISNQPKSQVELEKTIKGLETYGQLILEDYANWVGKAHEQQFFETPALRSVDKFGSKIIYYSIMLLFKLNLINIYYRLFNVVFNKGIIINTNTGTSRSEVNNIFQKSNFQKIYNKNLDKFKKIMYKYGSN